MKKQFVLLAFTVLLCLQGCCGMFYVPSFSGKFKGYDFSVSKREIDDFLEIGKTSMDEIQSAWGYPNSIDPNRNIWVYIGTRTTGYYFMFQFIVDGDSAEGGSVRRNMLLLIKFDKDDCLKRYELKMLAVDFVLDSDIKQQVVEWDNSFETQSK